MLLPSALPEPILGVGDEPRRVALLLGGVGAGGGEDVLGVGPILERIAECSLDLLTGPVSGVGGDEQIEDFAAIVIRGAAILGPVICPWSARNRAGGPNPIFFGNLLCAIGAIWV